MMKLLAVFLLFFLLGTSISVKAQDQNDSGASSSSNVADSMSSNNVESGNTTEGSNERLIQPVADSLFFPKRQIREVPDSQVSRYKNSPDYAYANDPQYWQRETPREPGFLLQLLFNPRLWKIILAILGLLALYGIYQLAKENNLKLWFRKGNSVRVATEEMLDGEAIDFDEAIHRHQAQGNYRMAIRYLYLRLIHLLEVKGGIPFRHSSTNAEIVLAMGKHPQSQQFRWLATAYEHIFYGDFPLTHETYDSLRMEFEGFQNILSN